MECSKFIIIDGGKGAGKSTVTEYLGSYLSPNAITTREPGGSPFAEKIRELILDSDAEGADGPTMFSLFWAARADHLTQTVIPRLRAGYHVVCDRFDASTVAYQIFGQDHMELLRPFSEMRKAVLGSYQPDCYIILDMPPEVGLVRARGRGDDLTHFDERDVKFHTRVRDGFFRFPGWVSPSRVKFVDATQTLPDVCRDVIRIVEEIM